MTTEARTTRGRRPTGTVLLEFLGSMHLAITLLVVIAIASVIGTVLQQNQPYSNYVGKFGPFWFELFKELGLYDIYGAWWFLALLGFLLLSTAVCVLRHGPQMVRDMRHFRLEVEERSLRGFHLKREWALADLAGPEARARAEALLRRAGYQTRSADRPGHTVTAAMKGSANRLGYLLSHVAIVVICLGGLIDGNLPLKLSALLGQVRIETRDLPISQVPAESILPPENSSFRGSVSIPEGSKADFIFLNVRDGYLVQKLPFTIAVKDFRLEHYATGQPKSFESDLVLFDDKTGESVTRTIAVNHPLVWKGYAIYQASFGDGGTALKLRAWPLAGASDEPALLEGAINDRIQLTLPNGRMTLELTDFKKFNIFPVEDDPTGKKVRNFGPAFIFKLRNERGEALEYVNYQSPVPVDGRLYFLSGVRASPAHDYRYLHIPLDPQASVGRFMRLRAAAMSDERVRAAVEAQMGQSAVGDRSPEERQKLADSIVGLVQLFVGQGIDAVAGQIERVVAEKSKREEVLRSYINVLQGVLGVIYVDLLRAEGLDPEKGVNEADTRFFDDSLNAFSLMGVYGAPAYFQMAEFEQKESTGLQITRAPGKDIVYLGCVMLMAGVFLMFYVHHQRIWVRVAPLTGGGSEVLLAGAGHRNRLDFEKEFSALAQSLDRLYTGADIRS